MADSQRASATSSRPDSRASYNSTRSDQQLQTAQGQKRPLISNARHETSSPSQSGYGSFLGSVSNDPVRSGSGTSTPKFPNARKKLSKVKSRNYWKYYVPILSWLPKYSARGFSGDLAAALTLSCLLVPQSMSYASSLAHLDPVNGLFGVIVPALLYSLFGTCGQLSMGPEAALSLLVGQTVDKLAGSHTHMPAEALASLREGIASAIVFEVGLITFLLGIFRLGFLDAVLSRALLRGFITAVGFVIFIEQLIPLLGLGALARAHSAQLQHPLDKLFFVIEHLGSIHRLTALISFGALAVLISARIWKPVLRERMPWVTFVPEILIVVVCATTLSNRFDWGKQGVEVLGRVSAGAVHLHFPIHTGKIMRYALNSEVLSTAATIAVMGYVDSIVAAKQNASKFNYAISPNRELTALGIANLGASLVSGTIPSYGSITRSRLAANAGARSPMSSFLVSLLVLLSTFFLLQYLYFLPKAILGCVVALVVYSILAECPEDVMFFVRMRAWTDLALMSLAFFLTLFVSVSAGIIASVAFSLVLVIKQSAQSMGIQIMRRAAGTDQWIAVDDRGDDDEDDLLSSMTEEVAGVLIVRLRERLHFANAGALKERLRRLELYGTKRHHPSDLPKRQEAQTIVLHMQDLIGIDASALQILHETCENYAERGVGVHFVHVEGALRKTLDRVHLLDLIGRDHVHPTVKACLEYLQNAERSPYEEV